MVEKKHIQKMLSLNLTQADYAAMLGMAPSAISKWYIRYIRDNEKIQPKN